MFMPFSELYAKRAFYFKCKFVGVKNALYIHGCELRQGQKISFLANGLNTGFVLMGYLSLISLYYK